MMKHLILYLLFFSQLSFANSQGEAEACLPGAVSSQAEELASDVSSAVPRVQLSPAFCRAYNACSGYTQSDTCEYGETTAMNKHYLNQTGVGTCGLSDEEYVVLNFYMGSGYTCLNPFLWGSSENSHDLSVLVKSLNDALKKMPRYQGFVVRGASLPENVRAQHTQGATVTYPAFTSSSTHRGTAENFGTDQFMIYSQTGRPIMAIQQGENEVLFSSNTKFRVVHISESDGRRYHVLREITGRESRRQTEQADRRVMDAVKANNKTPEGFVEPDSWSCPAVNQRLPRSINQTNAPHSTEFAP